MKKTIHYLSVILMLAFLLPNTLLAQDPVAKKKVVKKEQKAKAKTASQSDVKKFSKKTLKKGSKGQEVKSAQKALNANGAKDGRTMIKTKGEATETMAKGPSPAEIKKHSSKSLKTGSKGESAKSEPNFGKGTKKAVQSFQKKNKLDSDGIVGPKTNAKKAPKTITEEMKKKHKGKKAKKKKTLKKDQ